MTGAARAGGGRGGADTTGPLGRADALIGVALAGQAVRASIRPVLHRDREQAIADLLHAGHFRPAGLDGPFRLRLGIEAGRLVLDVRDGADRPLRTWGLSLAPFRRLLKDYGMIVDSYEASADRGGASRLQAIDMTRRALHDEAATLLRERLHGRIDVDHDTARRLFTLVFVLTSRG